MTEQDFIPGADIYLNPERQMEAKKKEELVKLRDQFAMVAFIGIVECSMSAQILPENIAKMAYKFADAMMEARK